MKTRNNRSSRTTKYHVDWCRLSRQLIRCLLVLFCFVFLICPPKTILKQFIRRGLSWKEGRIANAPLDSCSRQTVQHAQSIKLIINVNPVPPPYP